MESISDMDIWMAAQSASPEMLKIVTYLESEVNKLRGLLKTVSGEIDVVQAGIAAKKQAETNRVNAVIKHLVDGAKKKDAHIESIRLAAVCAEIASGRFDIWQQVKEQAGLI
jgi:hypothetical protein